MCLTTLQELGEVGEEGGSGGRGCRKRGGLTVEGKTRLDHHLSGERKGRLIKTQGREVGWGSVEWDRKGHTCILKGPQAMVWKIGGELGRPNGRQKGKTGGGVTSLEDVQKSRREMMVAGTRAGTNGMEPRDVQQDESCQTCCGAQPRCGCPQC